MRRWANVGLPLAHCLQRWPNNKPTLAQRLMFAGEALTIRAAVTSDRKWTMFDLFIMDSGSRGSNQTIAVTHLRNWGDSAPNNN